LYSIEAEVCGRPPDVRLVARQNRTRRWSMCCASKAYHLTQEICIHVLSHQRVQVHSFVVIEGLH